MVYDKIIVDADLCIKIGRSDKYHYLEKLLPQLAQNIYIHETVNNEIKVDRRQVDALISSGAMTILCENDLGIMDRSIYIATFDALAKVMLDKKNPRKNGGEVSSLAMAKAMGIPYFATDERDLQPIIDAVLNTKISDGLRCIRICDIVDLIKKGELDGFGRKDAKLIWIISGKDKRVFDYELWPDK